MNLKKQIIKEKEKKMKKFFSDFKAFITRGNILDMAVGVVIGGAFGAIVNALVNILLSVCTWGVPGGLKGLVTVLPAAPGNTAQQGMDVVNGLGQYFQAGELHNLATAEAQALYGAATVEANPNLVESVKTTILSKYTLHGTTYTYNMSAVIDWGTFINAIISFLIIAFVLFIIVRAAMLSAKKRADFKAKVEAEKYKKWAEAHPEEAAELEAKKAAEEAEAGKPVVDPVVALLEEIRDTLQDKKPEEKTE